MNMLCICESPFFFCTVFCALNNKVLKVALAILGFSTFPFFYVYMSVSVCVCAEKISAFKSVQRFSKSNIDHKWSWGEFTRSSGGLLHIFGHQKSILSISVFLFSRGGSHQPPLPASATIKLEKFWQNFLNDLIAHPWFGFGRGHWKLLRGNLKKIHTEKSTWLYDPKASQRTNFCRKNKTSISCLSFSQCITAERGKYVILQISSLSLSLWNTRGYDVQNSVHVFFFDNLRRRK